MLSALSVHQWMVLSGSYSLNNILKNVGIDHHFRTCTTHFTERTLKIIVIIVLIIGCKAQQDQILY